MKTLPPLTLLFGLLILAPAAPACAVDEILPPEGEEPGLGPAILMEKVLEVRPLGIEVVNMHDVNHGDRLAGTTLTLLLTPENKEHGVTNIHPGECKIEVFQGDRGPNHAIQDPVDEGDGKKPLPAIRFGCHVAPLEGTAVLAINLNDHLKRGTTRIKVKGTAVLTMAFQQVSTRSKLIQFPNDAAREDNGDKADRLGKLNEPSPLKVGEHELKFGLGRRKIPDPPGKASTEISLEAPLGHWSKFRLIHILDAKGQILKRSDSGMSTGSMNGVHFTRKQYLIEQFLPSVIIQVDSWGEKKKIAIPFECEFGLGLATSEEKGAKGATKEGKEKQP